MQAPEISEDEAERIATLNRLKILDTPAEERFDRFTRICARTFDMPIALISLVDRYRQWFKSSVGLDTSETARDISFCGHAILGDEVFEVRNAMRDARFRDNPLVKNDPKIRFYAGAPLAAPNGQKLGTLCIIDKVPRRLSDKDKVKLKHLADMVVKEMIHFVDTDTGLPNRHALRAVAAKHFDATGADRFLELLMIDACTEGPSTGTETAWTLKGEAFGEILREEFPQALLIAHWEGDRFCVLMPEHLPIEESKDIDTARNSAVQAVKSHGFGGEDSVFVKRMLFNTDTHPSIVAVLEDVDEAFATQQH
ncbi:MAG: GAF domain-containing protein [Pseudomonadales bacterium]